MVEFGYEAAYSLMRLCQISSACNLLMSADFLQQGAPARAASDSVGLPKALSRFCLRWSQQHVQPFFVAKYEQLSFEQLCQHTKDLHKFQKKLQQKLAGGSRSLWRRQHPGQFHKRAGVHVGWHSRWRFDASRKK